MGRDDDDEVYNAFEFDPWGAGPNEIVEALARDLDFQQNTAIPAMVESYDRETQKVMCTPVVNQLLKGHNVPYPPFPHVPVLFPAGGGMSMTWDLKKGDIVLLIFSMRSIGHWKRHGGTKVKPRDPRRFDLNDAIAIPGMRPFPKPLQSVAEGTWVLGDDNYDDPEYEGPFKSFRNSPSEIEIVVSERKDEAGEVLPDRIVSIDKDSGRVTIGEEQRGLVFDDEGTRIEDEESSVAVLADRVEVEVGSAVLKVEDGCVAGSVGGQAFEIDGDGVRLEVGGTKVEVSSSGKVVLGETETVAPLLGPAEVVTILHDLIGKLPASALNTVDQLDFLARLSRIKA